MRLRETVQLIVTSVLTEPSFQKHLLKKKKSNNEINHKSCLLSSYYLSGTVLFSLHTLSHVVLMTTCDIGTIIMPALQIRKLKLREII